MKTEICDFQFIPCGHGHYEVIYTSPITFKKWSTVTSDMKLIDITKNAESPKRKDLNKLKSICKNS